MFFVSALAETNRVPFDLTEGESELVSGFNVEYGSMPFAMFFLAEYANIILMSTLGVILFLGGGLLLISFGLKIGLIIFSFIWIRASFPTSEQQARAITRMKMNLVQSDLGTFLLFSVKQVLNSTAKY